MVAVAGDFLVSVVSGVRLAGAFQLASGNVAVAWLRRMASKAELFLLIRRGDRDAGGLHRELHLPRLGYVHRSTSCASSWYALLSLRYLAALCHSSRGLCLGWLGDVVGFFVESCFPKTEFFVFCGLECSGGARSAVGCHGNEKYMAVPLGAGVQGDGWHCLEFLRG